MPNYYLNRDGEISGPHAVEALQELIARREVGKMDLICPEGDTQWVPASILASPAAPAATMLGHYHVSPLTSGAQRTTERHVKDAYARLKVPGAGILLCVALPAILWAASTKSPALAGILTPAIAIGAIGLIGFSIAFRKNLKWARLVKASYEHKQR